MMFEYSLRFMLHEVDPSIPKKMTMFQRVAGTKDEFTTVCPRWSHAPDQIGLGNICWEHHLFQSNREILYASICRTLLTKPKAKTGLSGNGQCMDPTNMPKLPFQISRVPGDGRCGFRCLDF